MKLFYCPKCDDVVKMITQEKRFCHCKEAYGYYEKDGLNAKIGGSAIPLGFDNVSFLDALLKQPTEGMGKRFEAFIIPKKCPTVERITVCPMIEIKFKECESFIPKDDIPEEYRRFITEEDIKKCEKNIYCSYEWGEIPEEAKNENNA